MMSRFAQRSRKPNYTREETETLLDQLLLYSHFLFNKNQPVNNQQKADVWINIASQVNAVPNSAGRTVDELKHRWQDMAQRARHTVRRKPSVPINGNKTPLKPVPFLHKILQILGESHTIEDAKSQQNDQNAVDSTPYNSDSSCAANMKEEIDENCQSVISTADLCQSNGSSTSNSMRMKRCHSEATNFPNLTGEITKVVNTSETPLASPGASTLTQSIAAHNTNCNNDNGNIVHHDQQFESKRRRMKKSSHPRKSVSRSSYSWQGYDDDDIPRIQHKHIETFRSMVLDPESEIVMEIEDNADVGIDAASPRSLLSTTNPSATHNSNCIQDKGHRWRPEEEEEGTISGCKKDMLAAATVNSQEALSSNSNSNPSSCLPPRGAKHKSIGNYRTFKQSSLLPSINNDAYGLLQQQDQLGGVHKIQHLQRQDLDLEALSKPELDRQCLISQIRMQDQRTKYLFLKEQKILLDIEILKGKCVCPNQKSNTLPPIYQKRNLINADNNKRHAIHESRCDLSARKKTVNSVLQAHCQSDKSDGSIDYEQDEYSLADPMVEADSHRNPKYGTQGMNDSPLPSGKVDGGGVCDGYAIDGKNEKSECNDDDKNSNNNNNDNSGDDINGNDDYQEDESLIVSFGEGRSKNGEDCVDLIDNEDGDRDSVFGSDPKNTEGWEKDLQENMGM